MEEALDARALTSFANDDASADAALARQARSDPAAFGELYERYYARVFRYVYHRVGSVTEAEDLTAVVFMKALEALPGFRPRHNGFAPWLFRITRNSVVDHYRRRRSQTALDVIEHEAADHDPVGEVLGLERRDELRALVEQLSSDQRDVVLLRYAADLSFSEIAATLNKNEPAIRMLLHRGLRKLKAVMDDE